jgi:uncharacterized membrane protein
VAEPPRPYAPRHGSAEPGQHRSDLYRDPRSRYEGPRYDSARPRPPARGYDHGEIAGPTASASSTHRDDYDEPAVLPAGQIPDAPGRLARLAGPALVAVASILALTSTRVPFLGPALGFWFLVLYPTYLFFTTSFWRGAPAAERIGYSLASVILLLMLAGLAVNTVLPPLGVARPLDTVSIVVIGDLLNVALYALRRRFREDFPWRSYARQLQPRHARLILTAALAPVLAVLGANRLNNNAGDQLSLAALGCVVITAFFLVRWHRQITDGIVGVTLYLTSLALLLMTSLRGWSVTGHDIQTEYRVFQLTMAQGRWDMSDIRSAYNACLSLTILPTEIARVVNVDDPYIYKFFFQVFFALCPVLAYTICRRYAPRNIAILAAIYFVGFPTFVNDMPFLNRQEMAFVFLCVGLLAATNSRWPQGVRRLVFLGAAVGVVLSHYSTSYLFLGMIGTSWLVTSIGRLYARRHRKTPSPARSRTWNWARPTIGLGSVLAVAAMIVLWGGFATRTSTPVVGQIVTAIEQLGHSNSAKTYSIFSRNSLNSEQILSNYRSAALQQNATSGSLFMPTSVVSKYPTPLITEPNMPLTSLGRLLARAGVPIATLNTDVRQGAAKDEQLFVAVGFLVFLASRRIRRRVSHELVFLALGSLVMVGLFTIFPALSLDYGALRAFQEALILVAPLLVVGSLAVFSPFGEKWRFRISAVVCLGFFVSTIGLLPQVLGGYPAQLSLNNSGEYYDTYYMHPQDVAAVNWLAGKPGVLPDGLQASLGAGTADMFAFNSPATVNGAQYVEDLYPVLIKNSSWVLLNYSIVHTGRAPLDSDGELIFYAYPKQLLEDNKNLVYNNGGDEIYR